MWCNILQRSHAVLKSFLVNNEEYSCFQTSNREFLEGTPILVQQNFHLWCCTDLLTIDMARWSALQVIPIALLLENAARFFFDLVQPNT